MRWTIPTGSSTGHSNEMLSKACITSTGTPVQREAAGLPEMAGRAGCKAPGSYDSREIFNELFLPAACRSPDKGPTNLWKTSNEMRRQWLLAFKENGITTVEQINAVNAGCAQTGKPFMPSPGQFSTWCRSVRKWLRLVFLMLTS